MALDITTLLAAFALSALVMLVLFYVEIFRPTRSPYCGWWCVALMVFLLGAGVYLLEGTTMQVWAIPLGNALLVLGGACAWAAARTLTRPSPRWWQLALPAVVTGVAAALGSPGTQVWAGGWLFLVMMSAMFAMTTFELCRMDRSHTRMQIALAVAAGVVSVYYLGRWAVYAAQGPDGREFLRYFGSESTTLLNLMLLVVVSVSASALSSEQATRELTTRATRDDLTGLLNRAEFARLAASELRYVGRRSTEAVLVIADLDNFKHVNDSHGHPVGDQALVAFADACRTTLRSTDLVGRYGGEEFVLLLPGISLDRAEVLVAEIRRNLRETPAPDGVRWPTVSFGIVCTGSGTDLDELVASADVALYRAKASGRDRVVRGDVPRVPVVPASVSRRDLDGVV